MPTEAAMVVVQTGITTVPKAAITVNPTGITGRLTVVPENRNDE
jgi:hypothetical protein